MIREGEVHGILFLVLDLYLKNDYFGVVINLEHIYLELERGTKGEEKQD